MEKLREQKRLLRQKILVLRDSLTLEERIKKSKAIQFFLFSLPEFKQASTVMFFISFRSEVLTEEMIKEAIALKKRVVVPVTDLEHRRLMLSALEDYDNDLAAGAYVIPEPKREKIKEISPFELDLIVAPGSVFDEKGRRIGYGGGYYDRLLREVKGRAKVIAICFDLQIVDEVPVNPERDVPVDVIITEARVIRCH